MIQRIQTIWLMFGLLGVLFVLTLPVLSFSTVTANNIGSAEVEHVIKGTGHYERTGEEVRKTETYTWVIILVGFLTAGYLACIFSYRNRKRQMGLCWMLILFIFGLVAALAMELQPYQDANILNRRLGVSAFLPTASIIFTLLARRAIARDEALVRSADRLR
ncbi:MAG TPA: DUF4293 domain-containing protein [Anseongella sp.]|nr:DUF4293 domain-containing protein [Anseongella sp.]